MMSIRVYKILVISITHSIVKCIDKKKSQFKYRLYSIKFVCTLSCHSSDAACFGICCGSYLSFTSQVAAYVDCSKSLFQEFQFRADNINSGLFDH